MPTTYVWIGIIVCVFIAGIAIGDVVFSSQSNTVFQDRQMFNHMMGQNPQTMSWMMDDPQFRNQMFQRMTQNPDQMDEWMEKMMNDPQATKKIHRIMMNDPEHMQNMMNYPEYMEKMIDMMKNNPQMRSHMMNLMNDTMDNITGMGSMMYP